MKLKKKLIKDLNRLKKEHDEHEITTLTINTERANKFRKKLIDKQKALHFGKAKSDNTRQHDDFQNPATQQGGSGGPGQMQGNQQRFGQSWLA